MRFTLEVLSKEESRLVLRILNLNWKTRTRELAEIEAIGAEFSRRAFAKKMLETVWRDGGNLSHGALKRQWIEARESWESVIVSQRKQPGWWFGDLPPLGLPAEYPPVIIKDPRALAYWLLVRAVANGQHLRFVKCSRKNCDKFGMRDRARAESRYCSSECQVLDNADRAKARGSQKKRKSSEPFGSVGAPTRV